MDGTILIADDDRTIRTVLTQAFTRAGCRVHATASLVTLMRWVDEGRGDLVISDVVMPDGNGLEALPKIGELRPDLPVIVISAQNTIMTAIKATEADAYDYLPKPFDLPDLMKRSARALDRRRASTRAAVVVDQNSDLPLIGRTPAMQELYRLVARILNTDLAVLISGESGTGKSLIARVIHGFSDRRTMPYVIARNDDLVDIAACHQVLASAKGGAILFDEVGDLDGGAQTRLVQGLDTLGDHAPRIIATTQRDLASDVTAGSFRGDLFYRLAAVSLRVPALRARIDDISALADYFLAGLESDAGAGKRLSADAVLQMRRYSWPGNVRQLENTIRRLALTCPQDVIAHADVLTVMGPGTAGRLPAGAASAEKLSESIGFHLQRYFDLHGDALPPDGLYHRILHEMERPLLEIALSATGGNQARCADLLGINRNTLRKKISDLDIKVTRRRKMM